MSICRAEGVIKCRDIEDKHIQYHNLLAYSKAGEPIHASDRRHSA